MMIDFPEAWEIARSVPFFFHDDFCSYRVTSGGMLCDCLVLEKNQPKYTMLGDHDPTKWTVNKGSGTVTFSFLGHKIEMSFLTAHQIRAQIGRLDLFEKGGN